MLCAILLRAGDGGMIDPSTLGAWQELRAKIRPFIARRMANPADVDDVVQEVFLRMQRGLSALRDEQRFGPWIYQVARSAIVDHRRLTAKHRVADTDATPEGNSAEVEEDDGAVERDVATYIAPFVAMLASPYREALTLTELEGLTQKQAADMLGISLSGTKSRVQRGRVQLRRALEDCCHIALDPRGRVIGCEPRADGKMPRGCCELAPLARAARSCSAARTERDDADASAGGENPSPAVPHLSPRSLRS
jgi:RNA polymerase sigma-70 factor, ECF subfamily